MTVASAPQHCKVCMQKKGSLYAEFCGSMAAEQGSKKFWIMIELSHDLQIISHNQRISRPIPTFKGKHGGGGVC